jgi:diguanylate cyclase (GGDEF)-like protein
VVGGGLPTHGMWVGYSFLPFLIVALLGIFPLTLTEGLSLSLLVAAAMLGTDLFFSTLDDVARLRDAWLLGLLIAIALWGQLAQLHMLLRLYREATRDALTGLVNRRGLIRWLGREVREAHDHGRPLSVLLFDLDLFKRINDTHGHLVGDRILQRFARVLTISLPETRLIGRYGGEEFMAVLPGVDQKNAAHLAEEVREACHRTPVITADGTALPFTVSVGVATLSPGEDTEQLIGRVDQSLYQAKESGRDLVVMAS